MVTRDFFEAYGAYKRFVREVNRKTVFVNGDYVHKRVIETLFADSYEFSHDRIFPLYKPIEHYFPPMSVCKSRIFGTETDFMVSGDMLIIQHFIFGKWFAISFNLGDMAKALLLSDVDLKGYDAYEILQEYAFYLMDDLKKRYPKININKYDFEIKGRYHRHHDCDIRVRFSEILSLYMTKLTRKMVLARKPDKVIKNFYEKIYEK